MKGVLAVLALIAASATTVLAAPPSGSSAGPPRGAPPTPGGFALPNQRPLIGGPRGQGSAALQTAPPRPLGPTDPIVARYSAAYDGCMHKAVSTLDMLDCGARETERWDGRLNRAYQARMSSLNDRQRSALKRAEKAWLAFRDADCAAYEDDDWGTISRIDAAQCTLRRTVERTLELESFPADHGPG